MRFFNWWVGREPKNGSVQTFDGLLDKLVDAAREDERKRIADQNNFLKQLQLANPDYEVYIGDGVSTTKEGVWQYRTKPKGWHLHTSPCVMLADAIYRHRKPNWKGPGVYIVTNEDCQDTHCIVLRRFRDSYLTPGRRQIDLQELGECVRQLTAYELLDGCVTGDWSGILQQAVENE